MRAAWPASSSPASCPARRSTASREPHDVDVWPERLPPPYDELRARAADADGLLSLLTDRVDAELIERCPRLRAIANYAVGYDNIDLEAAAARGIPVGNTPDVLTEATADLAFALLLAAARRLPEAVAAVRDGDWQTWEPGRYLGARRLTARRSGSSASGGSAARSPAGRAGFEMKVLHTGTRRPAASARARCSSARTSSRCTAR